MNSSIVIGYDSGKDLPKRCIIEKQKRGFLPFVSRVSLQKARSAFCATQVQHFASAVVMNKGERQLEMDTTESTSAPEKRTGWRRVTWQAIFIALLVAEVTIVGLVMLFQEPEARTVAASAFACGLTTVASGLKEYYG